MSAPALPPPKRKRKHRSKAVELSACLYTLTQLGADLPFHLLRSSLEIALQGCLVALGIDPNLPWEMQHQPPLALRPFDPIADDYDPPENDYRFLRPMQKAAHAKETKEVDRPAIDKTRRVAKSQLAHNARLLVKDDGGVDEALATIRRRRSWWPKGRRLRSRGLP